MKQFNLEEYLKNPSKKVVTRDGKSARIICTNRKSEGYSVVALIEDKFIKGEEIIRSYTKEGKHCTNRQSEDDLLFASEKKEGWVNIFKGANSDYFVGDSRVFESKEDAEKAGKDWEGYITTTKIEWEE